MSDSVPASPVPERPIHHRHVCIRYVYDAALNAPVGICQCGYRFPILIRNAQPSGQVNPHEPPQPQGQTPS